MYSVADETRKPIFEGVQGENEARSIEFDITPWVEELGNGACTATAKRPTDTTPYPVTVTRSGNVVTWKPNSTDTAIEGLGAFQLSFSIDDVVAKTRIWNTKIAPSLVGAGDPPDPYDDWLQDLREIAADAIQAAQDADASADDAQAEVYEAEAWAKGTKNGTPVSSSDAQYQNNAKYYSEESYKNAEAWAVGQRGGVDVPSTDPTYENNAKYWAEQSLANQYGAYIVKSASGEIASFNDGGDDVPMKSVKVAIVPKQSGSGDPSPTNVRPITGTSTANVFVTAVNQWDEEWENGGLDDNGTPIYSANNIRSKNYIPVLPNTSYCFRIEQSAYIRYFNEDKVCIGKMDKNGYGNVTNSPSDPIAIRTTHSNCRYIKFYTPGTTYNHDISINYPSTDHEYHPYTGHTTPVPLGQTVYGGEVDVASGEGGANAYYYSFTGQEACARISEHIFRWTMPKTRNGFGEFMCNMYNPMNVQSLTALTDKSIAMTPNSTYLYMRNDDVDSVADMKAVLQGYAQTTPLSVLYTETGETPITFDPVSVPSLLGTNNVWSDAGAVEVEYRADPTLAYNELAQVIVSLGGNL